MSSRVLIADDVMTNRIILRARLAPAAYEIVQTETARDTLQAVRREKVDLVILPDRLPDLDALTLCRQLRMLPGADTLPVLLISARPGRATRLAALEAGIDAVLPRMPQGTVLMARLRSLLRRGAADQDLIRDQADAGRLGFAEPARPGFARPGHIALIAPSLVAGLGWRNALAPLMRDRIEVLNPARALTDLGRGSPPDAIVVADPEGQPGAALRLLSDLRCRSGTRRAAILMVQDRHDTDLGVMALDLGVSDLVDTGFDPVDMALRLRRELARKALAERRRAVLKDGLRLAATDPLTGLFNRRYAVSEFRRILTRAKVAGGSIAVMVLDLDRFKSVNDKFGHAGGDAVLTETSRRLFGCLRQDDLLARIGGEEFLAVIDGCDAATAELTAERLRKAVSERPVALPGGRGKVRVTMSIGLATYRPVGPGPHDPERLIDLADMALYAAKADGRNQVTVSRTAA